MRAMSKVPFRLNTVSRITFLVLIGVLLYGGDFFSGLIIIVAIPVFGWLIWRDHDRIAELERRLAALEKPSLPTEQNQGH